MILLLLCLSVLHISHCSCPDGFELVGSGQCRQLKPDEEHIEMDKAGSKAIAKCNEFQAQPVIIRNDEEQAYWNSHKQSSWYIALGLVCNTTSKKNQWTDGSSVDYQGPVGGSDLKKDETVRLSSGKPLAQLGLLAYCGTGTWWLYAGMNSNEGKWYYNETNSQYDFSIYCTKQLEPPVLPAESCFGFDDDSDDGVCYQIGTAAENWQDAQMTCKQLGANLASVHNLNENSFIRRLAVSKGAVHGVLLGATVSGKGENYGWIDGTDWDYDNFNEGTKIEERNVTCNIQSFAENTIITSPGFPSDASEPCDYYLSVDSGKKVEMEIVLLEANSCCDFLILDEGYFGGYEIANITGAIQNVTYTTSDSNIMKVRWQPNGGVNVKGMAITFRGV